jgi:hypothetical protein
MDQIPPPGQSPAVTTPTPPYEPIGALTGVITQPVPTMRSIAAARPWLIALLIVVITSVLSGMSNVTAPIPDMGQFGQLPPETRRMVEQFFASIRSPALWLGVGLVLGPIFFIIGSGITYLFARLFGGRGPFTGLLATLGYANVPSILSAILTMLLNLGGPAIASIAGLVGFVIAIWVLVLQVIGVRESMNMSTGRAVATILVPIVLLILLVCVLMFVVIGALVSQAGGAGR